MFNGKQNKKENDFSPKAWSTDGNLNEYIFTTTITFYHQSVYTVYSQSASRIEIVPKVRKVCALRTIAAKVCYIIGNMVILSMEAFLQVQCIGKIRITFFCIYTLLYILRQTPNVTRNEASIEVNFLGESKCQILVNNSQ